MPELRLRDGRTLAYDEWGDPDGAPLLFLHSTPGSRVLVPGEVPGVRLVTIDRPGYGRSDPWPRRTVADWTADVGELTDALGLDQYAVVGWSGGGPHALACAAAFGERVAAVGVVAGRGPHAEMPRGYDELPERDRELVELARRDPDAAGAAMEERGRWLLELAQEPEQGLLATERPAADRRVVEDEQVLRVAAAMLREAARGGLGGWIWDWIALRLPWGFRLETIGSEVQLWQGTADPDIPVGHAEYMVSRVPNAKLTLLEDEGHWLVFPRWDEIARSLTGVRRRS